MNGPGSSTSTLYTGSDNVKESFKYQTIQDAADMLKPGYYMCKLDLLSAYRSVKIHPSNFPAMGLKWTFSGDPSGHPTYVTDTRLPSGARCAPYIFHQLGQAVCRIMRRKGYDTIVAMCDDFLLIARTQEEILQALDVLIHLLRKLGFSINYNKIVGPSQRLVFLGILFDSINMTIELPTEKIRELHSLLQDTLEKRKVSKKYLQSLAGKLSFATNCIYGGRFYTRRLFDVIGKLRCQWHRTRVTREMRADIEWWLDCLTAFNGFTPMLDRRPESLVHIDACDKALDGVFQDQFVYTPLSNIPTWNKSHINYKEVVALEPAITQWAPYLANKKVVVHSDNMCAGSIINKGSWKHPIAMASLRRVFWLSVLYNFSIKCVYIKGVSNMYADAMSHMHDPRTLQALNLTPVWFPPRSPSAASGYSPPAGCGQLPSIELCPLNPESL